MPPTRPPYPPEFKEEAVRLMRSSEKPLARISRELDVSEQTLRNWEKQQQIDEGEREGLTTDEKEELARLRRENKVLRQEKEILRKARPSSLGKTGVGEPLSVHRRAEGHLSRLAVMPGSRGIEEWILRLEEEATIEAFGGGPLPRREDPGSP